MTRTARRVVQHDRSVGAAGSKLDKQSVVGGLAEDLSTEGGEVATICG